MSEAVPTPMPYPMGIPDPDVDYYGAIQTFATERVKSIATAIIADLREISPSGMFETAKPLRNVWDEWCWYQANYDNDCGALSDAFETTLDAMIAGHVAELPSTEAILLSCAICEDQEGMPSRCDHSLCAFLREVITDSAGRRSMAEFEDNFGDDYDEDYDDGEDEAEDEDSWDGEEAEQDNANDGVLSRDLPWSETP